MAVVALASDFAITVTASFPTGPPGTRQPSPDQLLDVRIAWAVAAFLLLAAVDHVATATVARRTYEDDLRRGIDRFRWMEYSLSATLVTLLVPSYAGITGITGLVAIAGANVAVILSGWLQEEANPPGRERTTMKPSWFGCVAGVAPWIAITVNLVGADTVPGFVFGISSAQLVLFAGFAVNQWLQYRGVGPWRSYAVGERGDLVLSLTAKSVLAWQVFAGSLAG